VRQRRQLNFPIQGSSLLGPVVRVSTRSQLRGHVAFRFGQDNAERAAVPVHAHLHRMLVAGPPTPEGLSANGSGAKLIGSIGYVSQEEQRAPGRQEDYVREQQQVRHSADFVGRYLNPTAPTSAREFSKPGRTTTTPCNVGRDRCGGRLVW